MPASMLPAAMIVAAMFGAAMQPKALGASIVLALGVTTFASDTTVLSFLMLFYGAALLVSAFRG